MQNMINALILVRPFHLLYQIPQLIIPPYILNSLSAVYIDCFKLSIEQLSFTPPSTIYLTSLDPNFNTIVATVAVSYNLTNLPHKYHLPNSIFIYNVCTHSSYRGKGYMKRLLISIFNSIHQNYNFEPLNFFLEVLPSNNAAKNLYFSLGFDIIDLTPQYELMHLSYFNSYNVS